MKRILALLGALSLLALCGCASQSAADYPVIEQENINDMELAEVTDGEIRVQYPADEWLADNGSNLLSFYDLDTIDGDYAVNVNVQRTGECDTDPTRADMEEVRKEIEETYPYITIQTCELRSLGGRPVIYMESSVAFTEQLIDDLVNSVDWGEDWVENVGGREALLALPRTNNVYVYAVRDGWLYLYTGAYSEESEIDTLLGVISVLDQTIESVDA